MDKQEQLIDYELSGISTKNRLAGIFKMMTGFRLRYAAAVVCQFFSNYARMLAITLIGWFIDTWLLEGNHHFPAYAIALALFGLASLEGIFAFFANSSANYVAEWIAGRRLRNNLYNQIQRLTFAYYAKMDTGDLIQRATSDVDAVRRFFSEQAIGIGRILLIFIINFTAVFKINRELALSTLVFIPFVLAAALFFYSRISSRYDEYQTQGAVLSSMLQENLTGVRVVKAFARQEYEKEKYNRENWKNYRLGVRLLFTEALFWPSTDLICGIQQTASILFGAYLTIQGKIQIGEFVAFSALLGWIIWPIRGMGRLIVQTSRALISFQRVMDILNIQREDLTQGSVTFSDAPQGHIRFDQVGFSYQDGVEMLKDISFEVYPGQVVAILGSTGSGKTTLVNLLPRFYDCTTGKITLDGHDLKEIQRVSLRKHIGIVEQEPFLFSRTIAENIAYGAGRECSRDEIIEAAKAAAIHDSIESFEKGYDTLVGERGVTLSGGQKQRVAIARTLLKNPKILIMDDSTSAVDTETEGQIRSALTQLMKQRTTFLIAHRIQSVMGADLILVLDHGAIVQMGKHQELIAQDGIYRTIYTIQTQIEEALEKEISGE